jgi:transcriptional regulator with XRE-family HTH domain
MNEDLNILYKALVLSGFSQKEIAKKLNLAPNTVSQQCRSKDPKLSTIEKYAKLCDMKPSELIALGE